MSSQDEWSGPVPDVTAGAQWGPPRGYAPGQDLLPPAPAKRRGAAVAAIAASALAVAGIGVGGYVAWSVLGGGGDQPEAHLPADTVAFAKLDLDPAAGQKLGAIRFARKFPGAQDLREDGDPRQWLWEQLADETEGAPSWSSVERWLGDRAAVGVRPAASADGEPRVVVVLEVTDEARAETDLDALDDAEAVTGDGWAYVAQTEAEAGAALDAARAGNLAGTATFASDLERLGEDGVAALWFDAAAIGDMIDGMDDAATGAAGSGLSGHGAVALRFDGDALELVGQLTADPDTVPAAGTGTGIESLPAGTIGAVGVAGAGAAVAQVWDQAMAQVGTAGEDPEEIIAMARDQFGIGLPDDLVNLLGTRFALALGPADQFGQPGLGAVATTDTKVTRLLGRVERAVATAGGVLLTDTTDDGWIAATTPELLSSLGQDSGLGASPRFVAAVPDAAGATLAGYVDVEAFVGEYGQELDGRTVADLEPLAAVGLSMVTADAGQVTLRLRVTTR